MCWLGFGSITVFSFKFVNGRRDASYTPASGWWKILPTEWGGGYGGIISCRLIVQPLNSGMTDS